MKTIKVDLTICRPQCPLAFIYRFRGRQGPAILLKFILFFHHFCLDKQPLAFFQPQTPGVSHIIYLLSKAWVVTWSTIPTSDSLLSWNKDQLFGVMASMCFASEEAGTGGQLFKNHTASARQEPRTASAITSSLVSDNGSFRTDRIIFSQVLLGY